MNRSISKEAFSTSLNRRLSGLKADPQLAQRIVVIEQNRTSGMRKSIVKATVLAAILCMAVTGALAAVLHTWGIIDFAGKGDTTFVPPSYEDSIRREDMVIDSASAVWNIRESYYDGRILRVSALVVPKEDTLLIGGDISPADPVETLDPNAEGMSLSDYALLHFGGRMAEVILTVGADEVQSIVRNEDGSFAVYMECIFEDEMAERDVELKVIYVPITVAADQSFAYAASDKETAFAPMHFRALHTKHFSCNEVLAFPQTGVNINRVEMTVTPLEIRYTLDYIVLDVDKYRMLENALWFEFVSPDGQFVSDGLRSTASIGRVDGMNGLSVEAGTVYRQTGAIGLDALGVHYTVSAYHAIEKTRYETCTFDVTEIP